MMVVMNVAKSKEKAATRRCEVPLVSKIPAALQGHLTTSANNSDLRPLTNNCTLKINKMLILLLLLIFSPDSKWRDVQRPMAPLLPRLPILKGNKLDGPVLRTKVCRFECSNHGTKIYENCL